MFSSSIDRNSVDEGTNRSRGVAEAIHGKLVVLVRVEYSYWVAGVTKQQQPEGGAAFDLFVRLLVVLFVRGAGRNIMTHFFGQFFAKWASKHLESEGDRSIDRAAFLSLSTFVSCVRASRCRDRGWF